MLNYVSIPTSTFLICREKPKSLHVLIVLAAHRNTTTNQTHFLSRPKIADIANVHRSYVSKMLTFLEKSGLIERIGERRGEYMWYLSFLETVETSEAALEANLAEMLQHYQEI